VRIGLEELIKALPKAEQHVHIVGSTRPETLLWLIGQCETQKPFKTIDDVRALFLYRDFPHFISVYTTVVECITRESQFERITYEMLESDARCNVRYVEASFSPADHVLRGLDYDGMIDAINRGISCARIDFGIECNIRVDVVRNYGPENGMDVLDWIEGKNDNVVSIDLGGSEERFPPGPFAPVYRRARKMGLHLAAHAGEAAGPQSVWDAVKELGVEHVGHGLAARLDSKLIDYLRRQRVTVEVCPVSNVKTGVVPSLATHPIKAFVGNGLSVTVNTDDPSLFETDMNNEYMQLHRVLGFSVPELFKLSLNGVDSSFLAEEHKVKMREFFMHEYYRLADEELE
jgi:adenosine deaminase